VPSSQVPAFIAVIGVGFVLVTATPLVIFRFRPARWRVTSGEADLLDDLDDPDDTTDPDGIDALSSGHS
jgi:hypothetical protein